jgi:hypothetical protein
MPLACGGTPDVRGLRRSPPPRLEVDAMALRHVAWFRFKDGVSAERIDEHLAACRSLVGRVPVVQNLECGPNLSDRAEGLTHCIIVSLPDHTALPAYLEHPDYVPVAEALVADVAELRVMDVEV